MDKLLSLQQKIIPEFVPLLLSRYQVLRSIHFLQPIGRRALADQLHMQERRIRNEVDLLKQQELVGLTSGGMQVTSQGEMLLWEIEVYIRELQGINLLEQKIAERFGIEKVMVVPGDSDRDETVKKDLARVTAGYLNKRLEEGSILAVTGGTTLAEVAAALKLPTVKRNITVIPARGGLGEEVEIQANAVAANIAKGLGASYRLLHVPDDLGQKAMQTIAEEPKIKEILDMVRQANIVMHGIGTAEEMARRRGMPECQITELTERGAVGEAFGYYFAIDGSVIHSTSSVGLQLNELEQIGEVIAVVGGASKAAAVQAVLTNAPRDVLVIDEGAARAMMDLFYR
ncbi:central glycolytic genes regulator [Hydrogenispora ethanolica]|uniref:Central glycolytic genes regulator n=1 Tax=Hydrogenispora ethanolica TaxID=1082276 RepID=A0A4R1RV00_HYDET|nr:sugar-binding domain-containing protein [Hydrogenispora ethanolica]TCL69930.1 central glycolytic genes regulator [Hydrogenispora ethanolica]